MPFKVKLMPNQPLGIVTRPQLGGYVETRCGKCKLDREHIIAALTDKGEIDAPHGRLATGVLIFQDLCVVPMMLVLRRRRAICISSLTAIWPGVPNPTSVAGAGMGAGDAPGATSVCGAPGGG